MGAELVAHEEHCPRNLQAEVGLGFGVWGFMLVLLDFGFGVWGFGLGVELKKHLHEGYCNHLDDKPHPSEPCAPMQQRQRHQQHHHW